MSQKLLVSLGLLLILGYVAINTFSGDYSQLLGARKEVKAYHEYLGDMADQVNRANSTWRATTYKRWEKMTKESMQRMNGARNPVNITVPIINHSEKQVGAIPTAFTVNGTLSNCTSITEIRDQANCGSCWAFSTAEAITDRWCIWVDKTNPRLSMEQLVTCCSVVDGQVCGQGCNGGTPLLAWTYWTQTGLVTGDFQSQTNMCQPYFLYPCGESCPSTEPSAPACASTCNPSYPSTSPPYAQDLHVGATAYAIQPENVTAIEIEVMTYGSVTTNFNVYEDFYNYQSGVYTHLYGAYVGGHAVKIIGWGVTDNNVDYWIIANSWNTTWGMNGFFQMRKGINDCGIEANVNGGMPPLP